MFGNKNKTTSKLNFFSADSVSTIAENMHVHGDIDAEHDMRIDGTVTGNIRCKSKIVIGSTATIEGDIFVANADIFGKVNGNIEATELLCLKSKCLINGNITVGRLDIEPEAEFNGNCHMVHPGEAKDATKVSDHSGTQFSMQ